MLEIILPINALGIVTGMFAISVALWSIIYRKDHGAPYVSSLLVLGTLITVLYTHLDVGSQPFSVIAINVLLIIVAWYWAGMLLINPPTSEQGISVPVSTRGD